MKMNRPIHVNSKEAIEIIDFLKERLNIPDNVIEFSVSFKLEDLIVVNCSYYPKQNDCN